MTPEQAIIQKAIEKARIQGAERERARLYATFGQRFTKALPAPAPVDQPQPEEEDAPPQQEQLNENGAENPHQALLMAMLDWAIQEKEAGRDPQPGIDILHGLFEDPDKLAEITGQAPPTVHKSYWALVEKAECAAKYEKALAPAAPKVHAHAIGSIFEGAGGKWFIIAPDGRAVPHANPSKSGDATSTPKSGAVTGATAPAGGKGAAAAPVAMTPAKPIPGAPPIPGSPADKTKAGTSAPGGKLVTGKAKTAGTGPAKMGRVIMHGGAGAQHAPKLAVGAADDIHPDWSATEKAGGVPQSTREHNAVTARKFRTRFESGDFTADDFHAIKNHIHTLTVRQLRAAKDSLRASFGGGKTAVSMKLALIAHVATVLGSPGSSATATSGSASPSPSPSPTAKPDDFGDKFGKKVGVTSPATKPKGEEAEEADRSLGVPATAARTAGTGTVPEPTPGSYRGKTATPKATGKWEMDKEDADRQLGPEPVGPTPHRPGAERGLDDFKAKATAAIAKAPTHGGNKAAAKKAIAKAKTPKEVSKIVAAVGGKTSVAVPVSIHPKLGRPGGGDKSHEGTAAPSSASSSPAKKLGKPPVPKAVGSKAPLEGSKLASKPSAAGTIERNSAKNAEPPKKLTEGLPKNPVRPPTPAGTGGALPGRPVAKPTPAAPKAEPAPEKAVAAPTSAHDERISPELHALASAAHQGPDALKATADAAYAPSKKLASEGGHLNTHDAINAAASGKHGKEVQEVVNGALNAHVKAGDAAWESHQALTKTDALPDTLAKSEAKARAADAKLTAAGGKPQVRASAKPKTTAKVVPETRADQIIDAEDAAEQEARKATDSVKGKFQPTDADKALADKRRPKPGTIEANTARKEAAEATPARSKAHQHLKDAIDSATGLTDEHKKTYHEAVDRVMGSLPHAAHERIAKHVTKANFHADLHGLTKTILDNHSGEMDDATKDMVQKRLESGKDLPGGAFVGATGEIHVDGNNGGSHAGKHGGDLPAHGVYAHELGHAIDGPKKEISKSAEWQAAFKNEILHNKAKGDAPLTSYASTKPSEGLAEFSRLVHGSDVPHSQIAKEFPEATKVFKDRGLWPEKERTGPEAEMPEAFDKDKRIELDNKGSHADVPLEQPAAKEEPQPYRPNANPAESRHYTDKTRQEELDKHAQNIAKSNAKAAGKEVAEPTTKKTIGERVEAAQKDPTAAKELIDHLGSKGIGYQSVVDAAKQLGGDELAKAVKKTPRDRAKQLEAIKDHLNKSGVDFEETGNEGEEHPEKTPEEVFANPDVRKGLSVQEHNPETEPESMHPEAIRKRYHDRADEDGISPEELDKEAVRVAHENVASHPSFRTGHQYSGFHVPTAVGNAYSDALDTLKSQKRGTEGFSNAYHAHSDDPAERARNYIKAASGGHDDFDELDHDKLDEGMRDTIGEDLAELPPEELAHHLIERATQNRQDHPSVQMAHAAAEKAAQKARFTKHPELDSEDPSKSHSLLHKNDVDSDQWPAIQQAAKLVPGAARTRTDDSMLVAHDSPLANAIEDATVTNMVDYPKDQAANLFSSLNTGYQLPQSNVPASAHDYGTTSGSIHGTPTDFDPHATDVYRRVSPDWYARRKSNGNLDVHNGEADQFDMVHKKDVPDLSRLPDEYWKGFDHDEGTDDDLVNQSVEREAKATNEGAKQKKAIKEHKAAIGKSKREIDKLKKQWEIAHEHVPEDDRPSEPDWEGNIDDSAITKDYLNNPQHTTRDDYHDSVSGLRDEYDAHLENLRDEVKNDIATTEQHHGTPAEHRKGTKERKRRIKALKDRWNAVEGQAQHSMPDEPDWDDEDADVNDHEKAVADAEKSHSPEATAEYKNHPAHQEIEDHRATLEDLQKRGEAASLAQGRESGKLRSKLEDADAGKLGSHGFNHIDGHHSQPDEDQSPAYNQHAQAGTDTLEQLQNSTLPDESDYDNTEPDPHSELKVDGDDSLLTDDSDDTDNYSTPAEHIEAMKKHAADLKTHIEEMEPRIAKMEEEAQSPEWHQKAREWAHNQADLYEKYAEHATNALNQWNIDHPDEPMDKDEAADEARRTAQRLRDIANGE